MSKTKEITSVDCVACGKGKIIKETEEVCLTLIGVQTKSSVGKNQWQTVESFYCETCGCVYKFLPNVFPSKFTDSTLESGWSFRH